MEYRQLGNSGLRVSKLCLGTMKGFRRDNAQEATRIIDEAIDNGINFIDTANTYKESEEVIGKIIGGTSKREKVVLGTKFGWHAGDGPNGYGASREHIISACEASLKRLKTDRIDLYIQHVVDGNTPWEETLGALDILMRQGKIRYIGTSKHPATLILEALHTSEKRNLIRFASEQPPYNILDRTAENELIPTCRRHGIAITPFFPIAVGILAGKYDRDKETEGQRFKRTTPDQTETFTTTALEAAEKLRPLADAKGVSMAQFSLAWLMQRPGVTSAVLGMRTPEYVRSAVEACTVELTPDECEAVDNIVPPGERCSNFYESTVYRPFRMAFSEEAKKEGAWAFIPRNQNGF